VPGHGWDAGVVSGARHLLRVEARDPADRPPARWPFDLPVIRQVVTDGFDVPSGVTVVVGENGSGKSTLVEALADLYPRRGGDRVHGPPRSEEDASLRRHLVARTDPMASPAGFFLRAEAMHSYLAGIDADGAQARLWQAGGSLQARSHGETFLAVLAERFAEPGFYVLDEPEAALSFSSQLTLLGVLTGLAAGGSQIVVATHSPLVAALPGATLLQVDADGMRETAWEELDLVADWRSFLTQPDRWLRRLVG